MFGFDMSFAILLALGHMQIIHPAPLFKPVEVRRPVAVRHASVRAARETAEARLATEIAETRTMPESSEVPVVRGAPSREVKLGRFVFSDEELAERQAAREGRVNARPSYRLENEETVDRSARTTKSHRHERTYSRADLYRDKNAWNRNDINGDGTRWGSKHPRSLSLPFHPIVSD